MQRVKPQTSLIMEQTNENKGKDRMMHHRGGSLVAVAITAAAIVLAGYLLMLGLENFSTSGDRTVSVRGVAERTIPADLVTWPLIYKTTANDLGELYQKVSKANDIIKTFLKENGIPESEISLTTPEVEDLATESYSSYYNTNQRRDRYTSKSVLVVKSDKVEVVRKLMVRTNELLTKGVVISTEEYGNSVEYEYTGLNKIKPDMIAEATKEARKAAEQFAKDSGSKIGKIKSASQGYFSITNRDTYSPHIKNVRVVTSVDYYMK